MEVVVLIRGIVPSFIDLPTMMTMWTCLGVKAYSFKKPCIMFITKHCKPVLAQLRTTHYSKSVGLLHHISISHWNPFRASAAVVLSSKYIRCVPTKMQLDTWCYVALIKYYLDFLSACPILTTLTDLNRFIYHIFYTLPFIDIHELDLNPID